MPNRLISTSRPACRRLFPSRWSFCRRRSSSWRADSPLRAISRLAVILRARALRPRVVRPPVAPLRPARAASTWRASSALRAPSALRARLPVRQRRVSLPPAVLGLQPFGSPLFAPPPPGDALLRRRVRLRPLRLFARLPPCAPLQPPAPPPAVAPLRPFALSRATGVRLLPGALLRPDGQLPGRTCLLFGLLPLLARQAFGLCLACLFGDTRGFPSLSPRFFSRLSLAARLHAPVVRRRLFALLSAEPDGFLPPRFLGPRGQPAGGLLRLSAPPHAPVVRRRPCAPLRRYCAALQATCFLGGPRGSLLTGFFSAFRAASRAGPVPASAFRAALTRSVVRRRLSRFFGDTCGFQATCFLGGPRGSLLTGFFGLSRRLTCLSFGFGFPRRLPRSFERLPTLGVPPRPRRRVPAPGARPLPAFVARGRLAPLPPAPARRPPWDAAAQNRAAP